LPSGKPGAVHDLFGGESREGGIVGDVDVMMGGPGQAPNDYLATQMGGDVPATGACAPGGAAVFDGYIGVASAAQLEEYDVGLNPITLGSIGWRGNGTLWSSDTATAVQRLTGLPTHGAGDVLMFVLDPATAGLWIGRNGIWQNDPVTGPPTWTAGGSAAFHPQIQGRNPGDGGTLRALPSQFSYPVPPGLRALGYDDPDLRIHQAHAFIEIGWDSGLSVAELEAWLDLGGGPRMTAAQTSLFLDLGGADHLTAAHAALYIEVELP